MPHLARAVRRSAIAVCTAIATSAIAAVSADPAHACQGSLKTDPLSTVEI